MVQGSGYRVLGFFGASWDVVTTYNWAYSPMYNLRYGTPVRGIISRVISPVKSDDSAP